MPFTKHIHLRVLWMVGLTMWLTGQVCAQEGSPERIKPPFGFYWGETKKALEQVVSGTQARIVSRSVVQGRDAWSIEGLVQPALRRTVVYFGADKTLVEVELQYGHPDWDLVAYEELLNSARKQLEAKYGPPLLLAREKKPEGAIMETVVAYRWQQAGKSLQLSLYSE